MNENPIVFSEKMVRAIMAGKKSQTRRIVEVNLQDQDPLINKLHCPFGCVGDFLWVCESWQAISANGRWWHEALDEDRPSWNWNFIYKAEPTYKIQPTCWLAPNQMPRMASRKLLEITELRIERLNYISEKDAVAEGCQALVENGQVVETAICEYARFWDSINLDISHSWQNNPFVWVISFR
jgi:hypothetical protein